MLNKMNADTRTKSFARAYVHPLQWLRRADPAEAEPGFGKRIQLRDGWYHS